MRLATSERARRAKDPLKPLRHVVGGYLKDAEVAFVERAYATAAEAHRGQHRKTGEPYITHPVAVATILAKMRLDRECLAAALLHDAIEDTSLTRQELLHRFGPVVAALVDGVTKLDKMKFRTRQEATAESFRKMLLAMAEDLRVLLIKLADRLHNMRTLQAMENDARQRVARETLDIYAPLAGRLGLHEMREELENLGFANLYPHRHRVMTARVRALAGNRRGVLRKMQRALHDRLKREGIGCRVLGRQKSPYSTYKKMCDKDLSFKDVTDVYAFRIIVKNRADCYRALGVVHELYQPQPGRFKDYIALPKSNGYQSLHTVLKSPFDIPIEIQIRTEDMDIAAEKGQAAHWQYKYAGDKEGARSRVRGWLDSLVATQRHTGTADEFMESIKGDLYPGEIFVFTPKGRIIDLKRGASALDFAYAIHTDVGNRATGALINRNRAPLSHRLRTGDTVEIQTTAGSRPRPEWLSFVTTTKARAAIRHHLKSMEQRDSIALGHRLLDQALTAHGAALEDVSERRLVSYLKRRKLDRLEDLFLKLAHGEMLAEIAAQKLLSRMQRRESRRPEVPPEALAVGGGEDGAVSYAQCCYPLPGDRIMGYLSLGKGIVVHRDNCPNVPELRKHPERCLDVVWERVTGRRLFRVFVRVEVVNRPGVLANISSAIGKTATNIEQVEQRDTSDDSATLLFVLNVTDRDQLARVLRRLRNNRDVYKVSRDYA